MKKSFTLMLLLSFIISFSQDSYDYTINFDDTSQYFRINIDTLSNPNNVWQIGNPQKSILNSVHSSPFVIITDTANHYPINDTSIFKIMHICDDGFYYGHTVILAGYYMADCDSLSDFGKIEFTPDMGATWINLIDDSIYSNYFYWGTQKPALTGYVPEWTYFYVDLASLGPLFDIGIGDTVFYKFTFISDSIENQRGGLMFDDLYFEDSYEVVEEWNSSKLTVTVYPIPAKSKLTFKVDHVENYPILVELFDLNGKSLFRSKFNEDDLFEVGVDSFNPGLYIYHLTNIDTGQQASGKFIVTD